MCSLARISSLGCVAYFVDGQRVEEKVYGEYKAKMNNKQQKENNMTETIPHLALRRQWLDDIEKDPKCVWRWRDRGLSDWLPLDPGEEPRWMKHREYSPQPKTKTYYMVMVKHSGVGQVPFGLVFEKTEEISGHLKRFHLDQVGDIVPREVEQ